MPGPHEVPPPVRLSEEALDLLERLAASAGIPPGEYLERLVRSAALRTGLGTPEPDEPALVLESTDEVPAIGPEGRGRKVRLKGIDETGEWDAGEIFVPDPPKR